MKKFKINYKVCIIFLIVILGLVLTKPTREDFEIYVKDNLNCRFEEQFKKHIEFGDYLYESIRDITTKIIISNSKIKDYKLFSIIRVNMFNDESIFVGILNKFWVVKIN